MGRVFRVGVIAVLLVAGFLTQAIVSAPAGATTQTFTDTTPTDFNAGNTADALGLEDAGDGSVAVSPGSASFNGSALPDGWTFSGSGSASVSGGQLHVDGGHVDSPLFTIPGQYLTFQANFDHANEAVGFGYNGDLATRGAFVGLRSYIDGAGHLRVGTEAGNGGASGLTSPPAVNFAGATHTYKISRSYQVLTLWVLDDPYYSTHPLKADIPLGPGNLQAEIDDVAADGASFNVDYMSASRSPEINSDFSSNANGWDASATSPSPVIAGGTASLDGTYLTSTTAYNPDATLDVWAQFGAAPGTVQQVGWQNAGYAGYPITYAWFKETRVSSTAAPVLSVESYSPGGCTTSIAGFDPTSAQHHYRVEISANTVTFTIVDVSSIAPISCRFTPYDSLAAKLFDSSSDGSPLVVDSAVATSSSAYEQTDFSSSPVGWGYLLAGSSNSYSISSGQLTLNAEQAFAREEITPGQSVDFWASLSGGAKQFVGLGNNFASGNTIAAITTGTSGGQMLVQSNGTTSALPSSLLGGMHHYRIDYGVSAYTFNVLDVAGIAPIQLSHPVDAATYNANNLPFSATDNNSTSGSVVLDSMQVLPTYAHATSRVFDAGAISKWSNLTYTANTPTGTTATFEGRAGMSAAPDSSWSSWTPVASSGASLSLLGRYAQYRVTFSTTDEWAVPSVSQASIVADAPAASTLGDTTSADFAAGLALDADVANIGDGAIAPVGSYTMPTGATSVDPTWTATNPSGLTMSSGSMLVNGTDAGQSGKGFVSGALLDFNATFSGSQDQQIGYRQATVRPGYYPAQALLQYSPSAGVFYTIVSSESTSYAPEVHAYPLSDFSGLTHNYRIEIAGDYTAFDVDGNRLTYAGIPDFAMRIDRPADQQWAPYVNDTAGDSDTVAINSENLSFISGGTFTSRVIGDASSIREGAVNWAADTPAGSGVAIQVRSGSTSVPDGSWSSWQTITSGDPLPQAAHFVQYQATFTNTSASQPVLKDLTFSGWV